MSVRTLLVGGNFNTYMMSVDDLEFDNHGSSVDRRVGNLLRETQDRGKSQIPGAGANSS